MSIAPSQQVLLKVRFLEASREAGRQLGVNWYGSNAAGTRGVSTGLGQVTSTNGSTTAGGGGSTVTTFPVLQPLFQATGTLAQGTRRSAWCSRRWSMAGPISMRWSPRSRRKGLSGAWPSQT